MSEMEEVDVTIDPDDLKIDIFHAGGHGGQNVNKVATAVRITHLPSGLVAVCQDERSQLKNKTKAMSVLRARLYDIEHRKQQAEVAEARRSQVGTGDRSEKVRTYNFPQDRITDHRIGLSLHNLPRVLEGEMGELVQALADKEREENLVRAGVGPGGSIECGSGTPSSRLGRSCRRQGWRIRVSSRNTCYVIPLGTRERVSS